jgi:ABC-type multidrug transport system fused ATPase/permease subunit
MNKKKKQIECNIGIDELATMITMSSCVSSAGSILNRLFSIIGIAILMLWVNQWIVLGLISIYLILLLIKIGIKYIRLKKKLWKQK